METISDDEASRLILLKNLKPFTRINLKNVQVSAAQLSADIKIEVPQKEDPEPVNDQVPPQALVQPKMPTANSEQSIIPPIIHPDSQEETDDRQQEFSNQNEATQPQNLISNPKRSVPENPNRMDSENQRTNPMPIRGSSRPKPTRMVKRKASSPMKSTPP